MKVEIENPEEDSQALETLEPGQAFLFAETVFIVLSRHLYNVDLYRAFDSVGYMNPVFAFNTDANCVSIFEGAVKVKRVFDEVKLVVS